MPNAVNIVCRGLIGATNLTVVGYEDWVVVDVKGLHVLFLVHLHHGRVSALSDDGEDTRGVETLPLRSPLGAFKN